MDFESNALYISFYVPHSEKVECPSRVILNSINQILAWKNETYVESGFKGQEASTIKECLFTGRIYIYSEDDVKEENKRYVRGRAAELGQSVKFREQSYADERNRSEKPLAFISHDSRDKESIASPLALQLQKYMCPVWYDEYSLKVGDSLREQIEKGLKECLKCILILTPNYLSNEGWGKKEFDSVFTRELIENEKVILPVWHGVSKKEVYEYSPALADRVAANWNDGVENVARRLKRAVESN
ncbi:MAG: toll/interleukin-1 receptor domain-containing protein [Desulfobacterales bacterium]|nr:toll/interleukin-1 receptor domain-containing protein [Desulfobacterales bacterium]